MYSDHGALYQGAHGYEQKCCIIGRLSESMAHARFSFILMCLGCYIVNSENQMLAMQSGVKEDVPETAYRIRPKKLVG